MRFEVAYKFTKGVAGKYYMCELSFPEAKKQRVKPMEWWELKPEGVIKDEIIPQLLRQCKEATCVTTATVR